MTDKAQPAVSDAAITPFGLEDDITQTAGNERRFPGQLQDAETGYGYSYVRSYDASFGRYLAAQID